MAKNSRKNIIFRTQRQSSSGEMKKFAAILIACVVGVLAISCLAILKKYDFDIKSAVGGDSETVTESITAESAVPEIYADKTYLLWCADDDGGGLHFAWLINVKLPERRATACTLDPQMPLTVDGVSRSINDIYRKSGENALVSAIESGTGVAVDGYIGSYDESFKAMINYLGGVEITVPEQIEYRGPDFTLILVKGKQNLKGDTLFKYLRYLGTLGTSGRSLRSSALLEMTDGILSPAYLEKRGRIFSKISNTLKTDLTIVDYSSAEEGIKLLMENRLLVKKTADSPEQLIEKD